MRSISFFFIACFLVPLCKAQEPGTKKSNSVTENKPHNWNNDVIYHVMQRSFYDSNGDFHGDLNGFTEKLDYLKELGVTTILFTPLYESAFYHNYFPTDYEKIDQEYGTMEDYIRFVKAVHKKGLKFLMDMETQYVQNGHIWFDESYKNPDSKYSKYIYYTDSLNQYPEQIFLEEKSPIHNFKAWPEYEGNEIEHNIAILNLNNDELKQWMKDFYLYWVDPNKDGNFDDGVDGFRIDHIMDNLDNKDILTNLYESLWKPIFKSCKDLNPNIFIVGEPANWGEYGDDMVSRSGADASFDFPIRFAIASIEESEDMYEHKSRKEVHMKPDQIHEIVKTSMGKFKDGTYNVNFIENHDMDRWATVTNNDRGLLNIGAILNITLPGIPSIYYGQELGLTGKAREDWGSDTNHIPIREAFPWTSNYNDKGNALWYKNTGPWWESSVWQTSAIKTLALSAQKKDKSSLWHHYQKLLELRKNHPALRNGDYQPLLTEVKRIMAFKRTTREDSVTILINTTDQEVNLNRSIRNAKVLFSGGSVLKGDSLKIEPYGFLLIDKFDGQ